MSQDAGCGRYLSPQQIAVIHYNLRTFQKSFLSVSGSTAALNSNSSFDYNVTSNETLTTDRHFKGNIIVKAGNTLTVKCGLSMTHGAKIIVEKTALLVVDGGTITNISGSTWDGIYVWGDPLQPSQAISSGMPVYQGMAKFMNNATISHAKIAVRNYYDWYSQHGGIITGSHSNFVDNQIDVDFYGNNYTSQNVLSASKFYNCKFKTTDLIGDNLYPVTHAKLFRTKGVRFYGCTFEDEGGINSSYWPNTGYGITCDHSTMTVDKNGATLGLFKGLLMGIVVNNYNPLIVPTIYNCNFIDNLWYGAYFMNTNHISFQNNTIQVPGNIGALCGVYLNTCKYYTIKNNAFLEDLNYSVKATPGLEIHNSGTGAHQVYRNSFSNLAIGINAMGDNSGLSNNLNGLKMNCNDFTQTTNQYDIALTLGALSMTPSVMSKQGETNPLYWNANNLVRNKYAASCGNQNRWYVHSSSTKLIKHGSNSQSFTWPTPQPSCGSNVIGAPNSSISLNYTAHCGASPQSSGGSGTNSTQKLANMNQYLTDIGISDPFERQSTVASKINLFLTDTLLQNMDSIINLLNTNQGGMEDADVQTVFAYMAKGDYAEAISKKNALGAGRTEWKQILTELIDLEQDPDSGIFRLNSNATDRNFFINRAASNKDGNYSAMAVLKLACDSDYTEPHNYPVGSGFRAQSENTEVSAINISDSKTDIQIYPNPTQTGITIQYNSENKAETKIEIRDLLGRLIYTNFIYENKSDHYVKMDGFSSGMYLITLTQNKKVIYKTKIIKED